MIRNKLIVNGKANSIKLTKVIPMLFFVLFTLAFLSGCGKNNPTSPSSAPSEVDGRVDNSGGVNKIAKATSDQSSVQGATVTLAKVQADGSLETVSKQSVQTDIEGNFKIQTDLDGVSGLIIMAQKGDSTWRGVVTSEVKSGITVYAEPLTDETTAQTEIYIKAKQDNDDNVTYSKISDYVNAKMAAEIKANASLVTQVEASIKAEADAEASASTNSSFNITQDKWQSILSTKADAQATLERNLFYASSQSSIDAAFETYNQAVIEAYTNVGVSADTYAKIMVISQRALINSSANFSSQFRFYFRQQAAERRADIDDYTVQTQFTAMGASQAEISVVAAAGATLKSSVENATSEADINGAFDTYHTSVINELKVVLGVDSSVLTDIDSSSVNYNASLMTTISSSTLASIIINAYINFYSQVESKVKASLSAAGDTKVNATVNTMVLLYANY
jgi:hypothetical protein